MQIDVVDEDEWVEPWLDVWARDMRDPELRLSAPSKASGFVGGGLGANAYVFEDWGAQVDRRAVDLINATLEGMLPAEVCAVHHVKLCAVYRFRAPVMELYRSARQKIGVRLRAADFA